MTDEISDQNGSPRNTFSEFFRNPVTFGYLEQSILPQFMVRKQQEDRNEVRIWLSNCAAGQDAYSIAMLIDEIHGFSDLKIPCRIFATDIERDQLAIAETGIYPATMLGNLSLKRLNNHFIPEGNAYRANPRLKSMIDFSWFDLLSDECNSPPPSIFGSFDLIFCSNIFFYYNDSARLRIIEKVDRSLRHGGYFITGESERGIIRNFGYKEVFPNSAIFKKHDINSV